MTLRAWLVVATLWLLSLAAVGSITYAQAQTTPPNLVSGSDVGFVVEGQKNNQVSGRLMVRVQGKWLPVGGPALFPAK